LCSTTTLRGESCCATRNSSSVQGTLAGNSLPLAMITFEFTGLPRSTLLTAQHSIPVLPHRLITEPADYLADFLGRAIVGDGKLPGRVQIPSRIGPLTRAQLDDSSPLGVMELFFSRASIAARLGVAPGAHQGNAQRN